MRKHRAYMLAELLIVLAVIAILVAIALPNFVEAQTRSKLSIMRSELRNTALAVEAYKTDHGKHPYDGAGGPGSEYNYWFLPFHISTPVSYMTSSKVVDVFRTRKSGLGHWQFDDIRYRNVGSTWGTDYRRSTESSWFTAMSEDVGGWILISAGPDGYLGPSASSTPIYFPGGQSWPTPSGYPDHTQPFDPTNGTASWGDIHRSQRSSSGYVNTP